MSQSSNKFDGIRPEKNSEKDLSFSLTNRRNVALDQSLIDTPTTEANSFRTPRKSNMRHEILLSDYSFAINQEIN